MEVKQVFLILIVALTFFFLGILVGIGSNMEQINELKNEVKRLEKDNEYLHDFVKIQWDAYWDVADKLYWEEACLNGTLKKEIKELKEFNNEALEVNTLVLFYAYNSTVNKSKLYWLEPNPEEAEKLLKKWGFDVK